MKHLLASLALLVAPAVAWGQSQEDFPGAGTTRTFQDSSLSRVTPTGSTTSKTLADWMALIAPGAVNSVNGNTGTVTAAEVAAALNGQTIAPGAATIPTQAPGNSSTQAASTAFVRANGPSFGAVVPLNSSTTLTAANVGGVMVVTPTTAGTTITLPVSTTAYVGATLGVLNNGATPVLLSAQGSDTLAQTGTAIPPGGWKIASVTASGAWAVTSEFDNAPANSAALFGAVNDAVNALCFTLSVTAGSTTLTCSSGYFPPNFAASSVGKTIVIGGVGAAMGPPSAPTTEVNGYGGTLGTGTVYLKITYTSPIGETTASPEFTATPTSGTTNYIAITRPTAAAGATGYNVYAATTTGAETKQNTQPVPIGMEYVLTAVSTGGATPPATSTAGGAPLVTTIQSVTNASTVTLATAPSFNLPPNVVGLTYGTEDTAALNACLSAAAPTYSRCELLGNPGTSSQTNGYLVTGSLTVPNTAALGGPKRPNQNAGSGGGAVWQQGPNIWLSPTGSITVAGQMSNVAVYNAAIAWTPDTNLQDYISELNSFSGDGVLVGASSAVLRNFTAGGFAVGLDSQGYNDFQVGACVMSNTTNFVVDQFHDFGTFIENCNSHPIFPVPPSNASVSVTGAANNGSGAIRLTVGSTSAFVTGNVALIYSVGGVPNASGRWPVTVVDGTHLDLQGSTFAGTYTAGGTVLLHGTLNGPNVAMTNGEGATLMNVEEFGWNTCLYLGTGAGWVNAHIKCDAPDVPDPAMKGSDFEGSAYGNEVFPGYISSTMTPVTANAAFDSIAGNGAANLIIGGQLYTNAALDTSGAYAAVPAITAKQGQLSIVGATMLSDLVNVNTGAGLVLSGCQSTLSAQTVGAPTLNVSMHWTSGSDLALVRQDAACSIGAPSSGSVLNPPNVFVTAPTSGATQTAGINTLTMTLENTSALATQTIKLPPITGDLTQAFQVSSIGGVTTATFQTSSGGAISNAPTTLGALSPRKFMSDGTNWQPVQ